MEAPLSDPVVHGSHSHDKPSSSQVVGEYLLRGVVASAVTTECSGVNQKLLRGGRVAALIVASTMVSWGGDGDGDGGGGGDGSVKVSGPYYEVVQQSTRRWPPQWK
ncbi:hypothetical protein Tco_1542399, partial [Tanacetum coccineum]